MSTPPTFHVVVAASVDEVCVIYEFETHSPNWINDYIWLAPDAAPIPLEDYLSRLCHLRCQLISNQDLEFAWVQIYWSLVIIIIIIGVVVVATKPILVILVDVSHQRTVIIHLHTPPKYNATTLRMKNLPHFWVQILHQVVRVQFQSVYDLLCSLTTSGPTPSNACFLSTSWNISVAAIERELAADNNWPLKIFNFWK